MHIIHCLTHSKIGGGQAVPYLLIKSFLKYYPHVTHSVVLPRDGIYTERFRQLNVPVFPLPLNAIHPATFFRAHALFDKLKPNIIHTHGRGAGLYFRMNKKERALRIHTHHGFHLPSVGIRRWAFIALEKYLTTETDKIVAVSKSEAEIIAQTITEAKKKISVIPNIVDIEDIKRQAHCSFPENYIEVKRKIDQKFVVLLIGRNDPVKNYPLAVQSARQVLRQTNEIFFLFVGIDKDDSVLTLLRNEFPQNVYATGMVENPYPFIALSHLLLMTSKREAGAPLVMLEAQALGVPVIGTKVRGITEGIQNELNGLLTEESAVDVSQAVLRCFREKTLLAQFERNNTEISRHHSIEEWCSHYYQLYHS